MRILFNPERKRCRSKIAKYVWTGPYGHMKNSGGSNGIRIAQLLDQHCTDIAEVMGSNPVGAT